MKALLASLLLAAAALAVSSEPASVEQLLTEGTKFDKKVVKVVATALKFEQKTSKKGNPYFVLLLGKKDRSVSVYGQGTFGKAVRDGAKVEVVGRFEKERQFAGRTFKNEIDVTKKLDKSFGLKLVD